MEGAILASAILASNDWDYYALETGPIVFKNREIDRGFDVLRMSDVFSMGSIYVGKINPVTVYRHQLPSCDGFGATQVRRPNGSSDPMGFSCEQ